jgi:hypothetical protein
MSDTKDEDSDPKVDEKFERVVDHFLKTPPKRHRGKQDQEKPQPKMTGASR